MSDLLKRFRCKGCFHFLCTCEDGQVLFREKGEPPSTFDVWWYGRYKFSAWHKPIVPIHVTQNVLANVEQFDWYGPVSMVMDVP